MVVILSPSLNLNLIDNVPTGQSDRLIKSRNLRLSSSQRILSYFEGAIAVDRVQDVSTVHSMSLTGYLQRPAAEMTACSPGMLAIRRGN
jgi:hypothetical protein